MRVFRSLLIFPILLALALLLPSCGDHAYDTPRPSANRQQPAPEPLPDGLYRVLATAPDTAEAAMPGRMVRYSHDFLDSNERDQPEQLWVDTSDFVPLELAAPPDSVRQPDDRIHLLLSLTDTASARLASFTERHLNSQVAIVVGGQAVTLHTVRSVIDSGKLQITRCTDNACEYLYMELKDQVKKRAEEDDDLHHMVPPPIMPMR